MICAARILRAMDTPGIPSPRQAWQAALTIGFATALCMWVVGFLARLPAVQASAMITLDIFGAIQITAGAILGAWAGSRQGLKIGALAGLITGIVNLLLVGSLMSDPTRVNALRSEWPLFLGIALIGLPVLSVIGAGAGAAMRKRAPGIAPGTAPPLVNWHGWFAIVAAAATLALLIVGGLVTSLQAGLAVPDWPNSFGFNMFLLPLAHMQGGAYFEHTHRLFGTLVGLTTLTLLILTFLVDSRRLPRALCAVAFVFVVVQGILGGLRVTGKPTLSQTDVAPSTPLALVHGVSGQALFALMCVIACITSARWKRDDAPRIATRPGSPRAASALLLAALCVQLLLGAAARHFDQSTGYLHIVSTHGVNALLVAALAVVAGGRAARALPDELALRRLGKGLNHAVGMQMLLGIATLIVIWTARGEQKPPSTAEVVLATSHQTLGALLLACAAMLTAWSRRLVLPARSSPALATADLG